MKPKRIVLVRHGESEGNIDRKAYEEKQDYKLALTEDGKRQADAAGKELAEMLGEQSLIFYVSPIWRTRMTFEYLASHLQPQQYTWREDVRLREQEWGHYRDIKMNLTIDDERNRFGTFYYRIKDGESCADVYDRMSDFLHSLYRDFEKPDFPENMVLVSHGMSIRIFLMRWFHWTVEEFEALRNPKNCEIIAMELNETTKKYQLTKPLKTKNIPAEDNYKWTLIKPEDRRV